MAVRTNADIPRPERRAKETGDGSWSKKEPLMGPLIRDSGSLGARFPKDKIPMTLFMADFNVRLLR
jgi:hypothetical protein